jgi:hypothetical protein
MADKTFNVRAILSAQDNGLSSALKNAQKQAESLGKSSKGLGSMFKSVLGANLVSAGITKGIGAITSGIGGMMTELNNSTKAWKTFDGSLSQLGWGQTEIASAKKAMQHRQFILPLTWVLHSLRWPQSVVAMLETW